MGLFNKEPKYDNVPPVRSTTPQQPAARPTSMPQQPVYPQQNPGQSAGAPQQSAYPQLSPAQAMVSKAEQAVNQYRVNLLLVGAFSVVNCLLARISSVYMLFSLFFPYDLFLNLEASWDLPVPILAVFAVLMIAVLFLCWALCKKNPKVAWIAFLVYLGDSVYMLMRMFSTGGSLVLSAVFHGFVLFCIGKILASGRQLERARKALAEEQSPVHNGQAPCNHPPVEL